MTGVFNRRMLLGIAAAGGVYGIAGCAACPPSASRPSGVKQTTAAGALMPVADVPLKPGGPYDINDLLSTPSFYIAHRGSGDNWPEHTMRAYRESVAMGLKAVEVSVSSTADGVLVCHHDLNTRRMTGTDLLISNASYAELEALRNDASAWLGPAVEPEPIPRLDAVLDAFAASHVVFLEDKQGTNAEAIFAMLKDFPQSQDHIVWKQPAKSTGHSLARRNGYTTWGYFASAELDDASVYMDRVDLLGVPALAPDNKVREFVDSGKPVIGWEVHRRSERDRLLGLGVRGMMCSNVRYVLQRDGRASRDGFASGRRSPGDLPWDSDSDWKEQPAIGESAIRMSAGNTSAYTIGSMGPVRDAGWKLAFELRWPEWTSNHPNGAGVMFGVDDDAAWRPGMKTSRGGYILDATPDGGMTLYSLDRNESVFRELARARGEGMKAGQWHRFEVSIIPEGIMVTRFGDSGEWTVQSSDPGFRGGYFSLTKNYDGGPAVEFRNVWTSPFQLPDVCEP
jgi:glycerophosphoryl diester phosphodiesterase